MKRNAIGSSGRRGRSRGRKERGRDGATLGQMEGLRRESEKELICSKAVFMPLTGSPLALGEVIPCAFLLCICPPPGRVQHLVPGLLPLLPSALESLTSTLSALCLLCLAAVIPWRAGRFWLSCLSSPKGHLTPAVS